MAGAPGARSFILIKYRLDLSTLGALIGLLDLICAYAAQVYSLCASVAAVYLPFLVFGRVLTRLVTRTRSRSGVWSVGVDVCGRCCVIEEFPLCGGGSTYRTNEI